MRQLLCQEGQLFIRVQPSKMSRVKQAFKLLIRQAMCLCSTKNTLQTLLAVVKPLRSKEIDHRLL